MPIRDSDKDIGMEEKGIPSLTDVLGSDQNVENIRLYGQGASGSLP
jgi:hypothetical protein